MAGVELERLREEAPARIAGASSLVELEALEAELLGRRSRVADTRRRLGELPLEERRKMGALVNRVAEELGRLIGARRRELESQAEAALLELDRVDVTLPGNRPSRGTEHLITQILDEVCDIFVSLGYTVATGPEVETDWYNFTALNIPDGHPARLETDTLYVRYGERPEGVLLRTHTSPMQARYMEVHPPPVYVVVPGRCFRRDTPDPTHSPVFHQVEGLAVDRDLTFADLKGTLAYFARQFFGPDRRVRFTPSFFPFTEPSAEMAVLCFGCDGSGCRICGQTGWIELLGCGMVDPNVFEAVGYDPQAVTGFAFGMGPERLGMVRHGIPNIGHFYQNDLRVLEQFR
ncbi:MAG: phenylalanine--tRNA ligase subunit alpha [Actinomycetota bacterium]|nr:phenylalanine--tRNA ligase subunit alpha [Actinomycetota bacterium]